MAKAKNGSGNGVEGVILRSDLAAMFVAREVPSAVWRPLSDAVAATTFENITSEAEQYVASVLACVTLSKLLLSVGAEMARQHDCVGAFRTFAELAGNIDN